MSLRGNLGFFNTASTRTHVRFGFSTHEAAGGNVAPNSAFEAADLRIYKATDGAALSATQRSSANGITMTSPFDSLTGVHTVDIDLTDNTDAGFYVSGSYYEVWLCPDETVDGQTITGICLAAFEVGVSKADVTQWLGTAVATPTVNGVPEVDVTHWRGGAVPATTFTGVPHVDMLYLQGDSASAAGLQLVGADYASPGYLQAALTSTSRAAVVDEVWDEAGAGHVTAGTFGARLDALISSRMATYVQPTGFLAATFPATVASTTNITAASGVTISGTTTTLDALQTALNSAHGAGSWATATGFATHSAADVWAVGTRVLTAGTNIQLPSNGLANVTAWTVNITGTLSGTVGGIAGTITTLDALDTAQDTQHGVTQTAVAAVQADLPARITKNTALAAFPFKMVLASDHRTAATGLTITATRSLDGAAFGACANAAVEISDGCYKIDLAAGDLNGNTVILKFTEATADPVVIVLITQPT